MLEFIVLGIIPGTQIQLSPTGVILLWTTILLFGHFTLTLHRSHKLLESYGHYGAYFTIVTKKHSITRRLNG